MTQNLIEFLREYRLNNRVYIGLNEVYKNLQRGLINYVFLAEDIFPRGLLRPIVEYCNANNIDTRQVSSRFLLGSYIGTVNRNGAACLGFFVLPEVLQELRNQAA